jgi:hypothetical protein
LDTVAAADRFPRLRQHDPAERSSEGQRLCLYFEVDVQKPQ